MIAIKKTYWLIVVLNVLVFFMGSTVLYNYNIMPVFIFSLWGICTLTYLFELQYGSIKYVKIFIIMDILILGSILFNEIIT
jgi:hypothetical protein